MVAACFLPRDVLAYEGYSSQNYCEGDCCCAFPDDPQAYHACAYQPYLRPQVIVGSLAIVAVVALVLINNQDNSHHGH